MASGKENVSATPRPPASSKKQNASSTPASGQRSIASFFTRTPAPGTPSHSNGVLKASENSKSANGVAKPSLPPKKPSFKKTVGKDRTPVPSSDAIGPSSSQENENGGIPQVVQNPSLLFLETLAKGVAAGYQWKSIGNRQSFAKGTQSLTFFSMIFFNQLTGQESC